MYELTPYLNLYWLNVTKCMSYLFMQIKWIHCVPVLNLGILKYVGIFSEKLENKK